MDKNEMRITPEEKTVIEQTFGNNTKLLKVLRKIFLPVYDPEAPIGQTVDLWSMRGLDEMPPEQLKIHILARQSLIMHVESQLLQLQALSQKTETVEEALKRMKKDSSK